jgi:hypothetical protein
VSVAVFVCLDHAGQFYSGGDRDAVAGKGYTKLREGTLGRLMTFFHRLASMVRSAPLASSASRPYSTASGVTVMTARGHHAAVAGTRSQSTASLFGGGNLRTFGGVVSVGAPMPGGMPTVAVNNAGATVMADDEADHHQHRRVSTAAERKNLRFATNAKVLSTTINSYSSFIIPVFISTLSL